MATSTPDEDPSFRLGELFDSYEDLERKLERFSKQSLVHYWRRDSRTVSGAHMKTARPISEKLRYYSVKYACIYGGQKFLPRGAGRRQSQSIRTNCPAHIMLRASKDGTKLEVTSVNNEHNHEISEELFRKLPQERKLCGEIKQEVQDLMQLHIDRKRLKEYVRLRTNKVLRSKDLFNIAAANKLKRDITPERAYQLFKRIHDLEKLQRCDGARSYSGDSEDEIAQTIKRIKKEQESPWGQDRLSADLEANEANECEDPYGTHQLHQDDEEEEEEEVVDDLDTTGGQLLGANADGDIITANGEIVSDLVMEDGDPSVIVESIVNADGSVFVDERDFNNYCNNHLTRDGGSPGPQVLEIESIAPPAVEMEKISRVHGSAPSSPTDHHHHHHHHRHRDKDNRGASHEPQLNEKPSCVLSNDCADSRIWIMKEAAAMETDGDSGPDSEPNVARNEKNPIESEVSEVVLSEEASHQLLQEQLAVLRAEQKKLFHETEMLKLKKDKLRLQMNCYSNEIRKQEMEKEKLRLEIKLLQSKVVEDANDVSHYIFVP